MIHWLQNASLSDVWLLAFYITVLVFFIIGVIAAIRNRR